MNKTLNKKIFVIGFNKTGTTSLHNLFIKQNISSIHTTEHICDNNLIDKYDAFSDGIHYDFQSYYNKYPNSLFILNTRPIKNWLISRYKHAVNKQFTKSWCWPVSTERTNKWIEDLETHFKNVLDFFNDKPEQLLIVNIERKKWENKVLDFIGKKKIIYISSHKNAQSVDKLSIDKINEIYKNVESCLLKKGYIGKELLSNNINISDYKYNNLYL
jgi:hypothetical protein